MMVMMVVVVRHFGRLRCRSGRTVKRVLTLLLLLLLLLLLIAVHDGVVVVCLLLLRGGSNGRREGRHGPLRMLLRRLVVGVQRSVIAGMRRDGRRRWFETQRQIGHVLVLPANQQPSVENSMIILCLLVELTCTKRRSLGSRIRAAVRNPAPSASSWKTDRRRDPCCRPIRRWWDYGTAPVIPKFIFQLKDLIFYKLISKWRTWTGGRAESEVNWLEGSTLLDDDDDEWTKSAESHNCWITGSCWWWWLNDGWCCCCCCCCCCCWCCCDPCGCCLPSADEVTGGEVGLGGVHWSTEAKLGLLGT